jgi:rRNA biogenesis protein RRP5
MILGQVSSIHSGEIAVALPNNITGYIPLTAVSDQLTEKLEALLDEQEDVSSDRNSSFNEDDIDLEDFFFVGQFLRASVSSTTEEKDGVSTGGRKRIELSVIPRLANEGLSQSDLVISSMVQASVLSVEDHGVLMDLGIPGVKGFISSASLGVGLEGKSIKRGSVMLCMVTGHGAGGTVVKLSADLQKAGHLKKSNFLSTGPTINPFLPGVAAEIQISEVASSGLTGKIMGMLDVTADFFHSGARESQAGLTERFKPGQKVKGRIICTFPTSHSKKLGFSLLKNIISFTPLPLAQSQRDERTSEMPTISTIIPDAKVIRVESKVGLFLNIGSNCPPGFVHISRVSDGKVESLSSSTGPYKIDTVHEARIIGHNAIDGVFILSMERKVIEQPFLRLEDVKIGKVLKGTVEKLLIGVNGVEGILVKIADHISGLVPEIHIADTELKHPEKKFREGMTVKVRVLSANLQKKQLRFTLKKSLVNSEGDIWTDYPDISPGKQSQGTLVNVKSRGAVVQFYGSVRGFLPVAEMSEAYIKDATEHFRPGQVVSVFALNVDPQLSRLTLSCKDPSLFTKAHQAAFDQLQPGMLVSGSVFEKSIDDVLLNLDSGLTARLPLEHLDDNTTLKASLKSKNIRVGQKFHNLLVLEKQKARRLILLSCKPSLVQAATAGTLLRSLEDVREGVEVAGFVKNTTSDGIFVGFVDGLTGLIPKSHIPDDIVKLSDFGLRRSQSIHATILLIDNSQQRFYLTLKPLKKQATLPQGSPIEEKSQKGTLEDAVDGVTTSLQEFTLGKLTRARITSVKQTQINVALAKNIQGRIHVSEVFDRWEDIKDKKNPLGIVEASQILPVRILGIHDARNHRFLPLTKKVGRNPVFELSARPTMMDNLEQKVLTLDKVEVGSSWTCYVNNVEVDCIWVNLSPLVRGIIRAFDASDDLSVLSDLQKNFPVGSAIKAVVTNVKVDTSYLTLSAKLGASTAPLQLAELSRGTILPGKVVKVAEKQILVQLNESIFGAVHLIDMADDYEEANPQSYEKNEIIRVSVVQVDVPNKKVMLSTRPSKILSSSLEVRDPEISGTDQLKPNDIVRGFIQHVADNGIFVTLGHKVTGYVRVSNLSDSYLKDWKEEFQVNQLVKGKVISVDTDTRKVQLSLKASALDPDYVPPVTFSDLTVGQTVTGKVVKVEQFGVFVLVEGSANVRGLCHRSEMADEKVEDARSLYDEGDTVKAKVLKLDPAKRWVNFGLKASYFQDHFEEGSDQEDQDEESDDEVGGVNLASDGDDSGEEENVSYATKVDEIDLSDESGATSESGDIKMVDASPPPAVGVGLSMGFDWTGRAENGPLEKLDPSSDEDRSAAPQKKRKKKSGIQVDKTGELDAHGPRSAADFERLLLGEPDSSFLWLSYMAYQLELSEVDKARGIAERAFRTIGISQETEKMNVWVALLNLENTYGSEESVEDAFQRTCQYNDAQEMHEKFASICIGSGKMEVRPSQSPTHHPLNIALTGRRKRTQSSKRSPESSPAIRRSGLTTRISCSTRLPRLIADVAFFPVLCSPFHPTPMSI